MNECKNPDGSTNWTLYSEIQAKEREERKAKGELCNRCGAFIVWAKGYPQSCQACKDLDDPEELRHDSDVRCPKCGHHWRVGDGDYYELYEEGNHEVSCSSCCHDFEVTTFVSHTFVSPERLKEGSEEGSEDISAADKEV